jgi:hypothetical protein
MSKRYWVACLISLAVSAGCASPPKAIPASTSLTSSPTPPHVIPPDRPSVDWERPEGGLGVEFPDLESASEQVPFAPWMPVSIGKVRSIYVTDPSRVSLGERELALVYELPVLGSFVIMENASDATQAGLESLAGCDPTMGCEGAWELVTIRGQSTALLVAGPTVTTLLWLDSGVLYRVMGPAATFSPASAIAVANSS